MPWAFVRLPLLRPCADGFGALFWQGSAAEASSESVAEARSIRRQRKLDQVEIPEDHLVITTDLLGKGGFGEVYLADYNGHNAAAKVCDRTFLADDGFAAIMDSRAERHEVTPASPRLTKDNSLQQWTKRLDANSLDVLK